MRGSPGEGLGEAGGEPVGWLFASSYETRPDQTPAAEGVQQMIAQTLRLMAKALEDAKQDDNPFENPQANQQGEQHRA